MPASRKIRNAKRSLSDKVARLVEQRTRAARCNPDPLAGQGDFEALAKGLARAQTGAAASLHEGLAEIFTVTHLRVPPTLDGTLRSTNCVESMIEICRDHSKNMQRCKSGTMVLPWRAAGLFEAKKQFRRVSGHLHLREIHDALDDHIEMSDSPQLHCRSGGGRIAQLLGTVTKFRAKWDLLRPRRTESPMLCSTTVSIPGSRCGGS